MTDTPFRKTLSLKRQKPTETTSNHESNNSNDNNGRNNKPSQPNHPTHNSKRHFQEQEVSCSTQKQHQSHAPDYVAELAKNDLLLQDLQKKRKGLLEQIKVLEQRLVFISSEPLQAACNELQKEDTAILCQINDYLVKNS